MNAQSINYYIALSDELSIYIDGMGAEDLINSAKELLHCYTVLTYARVHQQYQILAATEKLTQYGITLDQCATLAHGLLAKAI